jgi:hypothetical protein
MAQPVTACADSAPVLAGPAGGCVCVCGGGGGRAVGCRTRAHTAAAAGARVPVPRAGAAPHHTPTRTSVLYALLAGRQRRAQLLRQQRTRARTHAIHLLLCCSPGAAQRLPPPRQSAAASHWCCWVVVVCHWHPRSSRSAAESAGLPAAACPCSASTSGGVRAASAATRGSYAVTTTGAQW